MHEMNEIEQNLLDSLEEARTEIKALKRDCVVCGERCEVPAGVPWRAARCPEHMNRTGSGTEFMDHVRTTT